MLRPISIPTTKRWSRFIQPPCFNSVYNAGGTGIPGTRPRGILVAISPHWHPLRPARLLWQNECFRGIVRGQPSVRLGLGGILHTAVILRSGKGRQPPIPSTVWLRAKLYLLSRNSRSFSLFYTRGEADLSRLRPLLSCLAHTRPPDTCPVGLSAVPPRHDPPIMHAARTGAGMVRSKKRMHPTILPKPPSPGYPNGYVSYSNASRQVVNPYNGQTVSRSDPWWHIKLK